MDTVRFRVEQLFGLAIAERLGQERAAENGLPGAEQLAHRLIRVREPAADTGDMQVLSVEAPDDRAPSTKQPERAAGDRVEDWLDIGARLADDAQDIGRGRLSIECLAYLRV